MSTQHTPGPWEVCPSNNEIINTDHGRLPFAIRAGYTLIGALYENEADALLIAAAPELLEALKAMLLHTAELNPMQGYDKHDCQAVKQAAAAIAKATGETK